MEKNYKKSTDRGNKRKDYMKLPLIELLSLVASKAEDPSTSDRALLALIERVNPFLRSKTHYFCSIYRIYSTLEEQEVVSSITLTMYHDIQTLLEKMNQSTEEQHNQILESWMSNSIESLLKQYQSKRKQEIKIVYDDIEIYSQCRDDSDESTSEDNDQILTEQKAIFEQVKSLINPKNYRIALLYCQHNQGRKRMPVDVLKKISKESDITPNYAAKINRRTLQKLYTGCHKLAIQKGLAKGTA